MDTWWSARQQQTLRTGDVMPLPLMVETNWAAEGWEVNIALVTSVERSGYSSMNIWTHREPYREGDPSSGPDEADRVTEAAVMEFGLKLRNLLA
jgi:hypothetical protein